jgi:REP element-mobilizing transposase RayT
MLEIILLFDIATFTKYNCLMRSPKQLGFQILETKNVKHFGGDYLGKSNPKKKRPLSTKKAMHLVMRSSLAKGAYSLRRQDKDVFKIIQKQARQLGIKLYKFANGGNHLHMIILPVSRAAFNKFVRAISGLIARLILAAERGRPTSDNIQFWDKRPFSRILEWGTDFYTTCDYLLKNTLKAYGFFAYTPGSQAALTLKPFS